MVPRRLSTFGCNFSGENAASAPWDRDSYYKMLRMEPLPRHQCLIYDGAPSRQLPALAALVREKLAQNYRCLYLNSAPMVAGMRSYLAAAGVDVAREVEKASLVLSSELGHLVGGQFDVERLIRTIEDAIQQALDDGYAGLWATGRVRQVDRNLLPNATYGVDGPGGGVLRIAATTTLACERDVRVSMTAMTIGMAYMVLAMQLVR